MNSLLGADDDHKLRKSLDAVLDLLEISARGDERILRVVALCRAHGTPPG